jgi:hypothetical protein
MTFTHSTRSELRQSARHARQAEITTELLDLITGAEELATKPTRKALSYVDAPGWQGFF